MAATLRERLDALTRQREDALAEAYYNELMNEVEREMEQASRPEAVARADFEREVDQAVRALRDNGAASIEVRERGQTIPRAWRETLATRLPAGLVVSVEGSNAPPFVTGDTNEDMYAWMQAVGAEHYDDENDGVTLNIERVATTNTNPYNAGAAEQIGFLASAENGDCVVEAFIRKWPRLRGCEAIDEFRRPIAPSDIEELADAVGRELHTRVGVSLVDRAGNEWWEYKTNGKRSDCLITITVDQHHGRLQTVETERVKTVRVAPRAELDREILAGRTISATRAETKTASIVCEDEPTELVVASEHIDALVAEYEDLQERGALPAGEGPTPARLRELLCKTVRFARCTSVAGVFWRLWRDTQPQLAPAEPGTPIYRALKTSQIEAGAYETADVEGGETAYDLIHAYSSFDYTPPDCPVSYDAYGFPGLPQMALDSSTLPKEDVLAVTGFCRVVNVRVNHWAVEKLGFLVEGRYYPSVWLAYLHRRGLATFDLDQWLPAPRFAIGLQGPRRLFRVLIGKLTQRRLIDRTFFAAGEAERDRLVVANIGRLFGLERGSVGGVRGAWITTARKNPRRYPHVRSFALAYSHVKVMELLRLCNPEDVLKVKTDSVAVRPGSESAKRVDAYMHPPNGDDQLVTGSLAKTAAGRWKTEEIRKTKPKSPMRPAQLPRLVNSAPVTDDTEVEITQPEPLRLGKTVEGAAGYDRDWSEIGGSSTEYEPYIVEVEGAGGSGKSTWLAQALAAASKTLVVARGYRQSRVSRDKLQNDASSTCVSALTSAALGRDGTPFARSRWERHESRPSAVWIEEASLLCPTVDQPQVLEASKMLGASLVAFCGDWAQLPPICDDEKCFSHKTPGYTPALKISCIRDHRSTDDETREMKATLRQARLSGDPEPALSSFGLRTIDLNSAVARAVEAEELGTVVCATNAQVRQVNAIAARLIAAKYEVETIADVPVELPARCIKVHTRRYVDAGGNRTSERIGTGTYEYRSPATFGETWELAVGCTCDVAQGSTIDGEVFIMQGERRVPKGWVYTAGTRHRSADQISLVVG